MLGDEFIAVATQLLTNQNEARLRSAVSRAYYGVYHTARGFIQSLDVIIPKYDSHDKLWWCFQEAGEPETRVVANGLNLLRRERNFADYDFDDRRFTTQDTARTLVRLAIEVVDRLNACRIEPLHSRLHASIRQYATNVLKWPIS